MRTSCECWDPTPPSVRTRREGRASAIIMKIGILGGSFNPIHLGHLIIAQDALEAFGLDRILFMPCASPPHKTAAEMVSAEHRREMVEAAVADHAPFDVSAVEIERGGVSYSIDTVRQLQADDPDPEWNLIIGGDSLAEFHLWRDVEELLQLCAVLTIVRPGFERDQIAASLGLEPDWTKKLLAHVATGHSVKISSSDVRSRIRGGLPIRYLVPDTVSAYIDAHGLYR